MKEKAGAPDWTALSIAGFANPRVQDRIFTDAHICVESGLVRLEPP